MAGVSTASIVSRGQISGDRVDVGEHRAGADVTGAFVVAMKENDGTTTSSPARCPHDQGQCNAVVQLETATAWSA